MSEKEDPTYKDSEIEGWISGFKIEIESRSMSYPPLSEIDLKKLVAWVWSSDTNHLGLRSVGWCISGSFSRSLAQIIGVDKAVTLI